MSVSTSGSRKDHRSRTPGVSDPGSATTTYDRCVRSGVTPSPGEQPEELAPAELAARASISPQELERLVASGVLIPRDGTRPFRTADVLKVRVARACEAGGLPMAGMAQAIRAGLLSFAFVESWPFEPEGSRQSQTHLELAEEAGLPFESLQGLVEAFGFVRPEPEDVIVGAERPIALLAGRLAELEIVDEATLARLGHVYAEAFRRIALAETEVYHSGVEVPLLRSGLGESRTMELASSLSPALTGMLDEAVKAAYRRQQEVTWIEHQIEHVEQALEDAGISLPVTPPTAMCFLDLSGYTRLTEERGDEEAAALAGRLSDIVQQGSRLQGGEAVKWVGDGVMFRFRDPSGAVVSALDMVEEIPAAGLPPAHVGVAAGPVIRQGGDYYGRTVNLASRISDRAAAGQVLVSEPVVEKASVPGVTFVGIGSIELKGLKGPVDLFEARRA
jgi:adenylate cyclase